MAPGSKSPKRPTRKQEAVSATTPPERLEELARANTELARLVARNESADPELLRRLAARRDETIRKGVATNPNTPTDVLVKLWEKFPEQLFDNPVFSLLLLENPNLLEEIPLTTLHSILKLEGVPEYFLDLAASHSNYDILEAVARHPNTPGRVLEKLAGNSRVNVWFVGHVIRHPNFPPTALERLAEHPDKWVRACIAGQSNTPGSVLERLARYDKIDLDVAIALAQNPSTPESVLERLVANRDPYICHVLATNPNIPSRVLEQLASVGNFIARLDVAMHPNTPAYVLQQLAGDNSRLIRRALAQNPATPQHIREQLASRCFGGEL